jgi:glycosyltransferase involved in cell wall biosynthesis
MERQLIENISPTAQNSQPTALVMLSLSEKLLLTRRAHERGIKVFWIEHDRIGRWLTWNPWLSLLKKQSAFATIICVSELSRQKYVALGFDAGNIVVIPNGVPFPSAPTAPVQSPKFSLLRIGCIARLRPEKGVVVLLQAVADMQGVTLEILGHGEQEGYIRKIIAEDDDRMHLSRIRLRTSVDDLEAFYASIDLLVLPSVDHDPFGLVAAEAMVRGIAVVVTDACGIASHLHSAEDASIVKAGVAEDLRGAIVSLMDQKLRKRIALAGQRTALASFSLERMIKHYEDCIRRR